MSQNKSRTYINIASFKLNRISLFNQSGFNPFLHKEKKTKNYINLFKQENNIQKINPLTKKNKIIKRHNILKKIDFYINDNKTYIEKNNNNSSKDLSLINSKPPSQRNNIHLPFLVYNNNYRLLQNEKRNRNNYSQPINLYKNYNLKNSYSYISNSVFSQNNLFNSNYQQNESNKNLKPNYTDKEIQTCDESQINSILSDKNRINISKINLNNNKIYKINLKSKITSNEKMEDDSNDDNDYKKEIEKIMSNKSRSHIRNLQEINKFIFHNNKNNIKKIDPNEYKNFVLLKNLYKIKNFKSEKLFKTEQNIIMQDIKLKKLDKNFFNKINISKIQKNLRQGEQRLINFKRSQKIILPKTYIYNLLNQNYESKVQYSGNN